MLLFIGYLPDMHERVGMHKNCSTHSTLVLAPSGRYKLEHHRKKLLSGLQLFPDYLQHDLLILPLCVWPSLPLKLPLDFGLFVVISACLLDSDYFLLPFFAWLSLSLPLFLDLVDYLPYLVLCCSAVSNLGLCLNSALTLPLSSDLESHCLEVSVFGEGLNLHPVTSTTVVPQCSCPWFLFHYSQSSTPWILQQHRSGTVCNSGTTFKSVKQEVHEEPSNPPISTMYIVPPVRPAPHWLTTV